MRPRIQPITTLTKVQNAISIIELKYSQRAIIIITFFSIIQITIKELRKPNTNILLLLDINLVKFLLPLLCIHRYGYRHIIFFNISNDKVLEKHSKFMKLYPHISCACLILCWFDVLCKWAHQGDKLIINLLDQKHLTRSQQLRVVICNDTQPTTNRLVFLNLTIYCHLTQRIDTNTKCW